MLKRISIGLNILAIALTVTFGMVPSAAEAIVTTPICNSAQTCEAVGLNLVAATLRRPNDDTLGRAHIGIFIMHSYSSSINYVGCAELATRGYTTLCGDSIFTNNPNGYYGYEQHAPGIKSAINYLKML